MASTALSDALRIAQTAMTFEGNLGHSYNAPKVVDCTFMARTSFGRESNVGDFYTTMDDFIAYAILPTLGDYADDYDVDAIAEEAAEWVNGETPNESGYRFKPIYGEGEFNAAYWMLVASHDLTV